MRKVLLCFAVILLLLSVCPSVYAQDDFSNSDAISDIIEYGMQFIGVPYIFGGTSPNGFDCAGYVRYVFAEHGIHLPRTADAQFEHGQWVASDNLEPGDLVFFTTTEQGVSHVGIYIGDGKFLNAQSSKGVAIANLANSYWSSRYVGAKRVC